MKWDVPSRKYEINSQSLVGKIEYEIGCRVQRCSQSSNWEKLQIICEIKQKAGYFTGLLFYQIALKLSGFK